MAKRSVGRRTILNDEIKQKMSEMIRNGSTFKMAINAMQIGERTFYLWLTKGEEVLERIEEAETKGEEYTFIENEEAYLQFMQSIKKAESEAMQRNVGLIQIAAKDNWQAAAWYLERRDPDNFGRKYRMEHSGNKENPVHLTYEEQIKKRRKERGLDEGGEETLMKRKSLNIANKSKGETFMGSIGNSVIDDDENEE